jgi:hypothetical protein
MTDAFGQTGKSQRAGTLAGWANAVVAKLSRADDLRGVDPAEFERVARDLNLPLPELYGLLTGRRVSADALGKHLAAEFEGSPQLARKLRAIEQEHLSARIRASLPIGPSCC